MPERFFHARYLWRAVRLGTVCWLGAACGCGPNAGGPKTFPLAGIVTLDGTPVADADITFLSSSGESAIAGGNAFTHDDGSYVATIFVDGGKNTVQGLPAGEYNVELVKLEHASGNASLSKPPRNVLPARYGSIQSSGLTVTVNSEGKNQHDFHLRSP